MSLLDWKRIYDWAEKQELGSILGISCTNSECPLAHYLHAQTGKLWTVGPSIRPMDGTKYNNLAKPAWVHALMNKVDMSAGVSVTREQFLKILEEVKPTDQPTENF